MEPRLSKRGTVIILRFWNYLEKCQLNCVTSYHIFHQVKTPEKILARNRASYWKFRERRLAYIRKYAASHRQETRNYREKTRVRRAMTNRVWRRKHLKQLAAKMRQYRAQHVDRFRELDRKRVRPAEYRKKFNEYRREYSKKNPHKIQQWYQKRRAQRSQCESTLTAGELREQRRIQNGICFYCKGPYLLTGHVDHKTPLVRGGANSASNVVIACAKCNLSKGTKTAEEFMSLLK